MDDVYISTPDSPDYADVQDEVRYAATFKGVCKSDKGGISNDYVIKRLLTKEDGQFPVILHKATRHPTEWHVGFLLLRIRRNGRIYIDAVCADEKGVGKMLIQRAITWGREKGYSTIQLSSLPHLESYYKRFGFRYPKEGGRRNGYAMEKKLRGWRGKDPLFPNWNAKPVRRPRMYK